jgi:hypothetical protein
MSGMVKTGVEGIKEGKATRGYTLCKDDQIIEETGAQDRREGQIGIGEQPELYKMAYRICSVKIQSDVGSLSGGKEDSPRPG